MLTMDFCIAAGKKGGGTFLPNCGNSGATSLIPAGAGQKVNGWGPFFSNDSHGYIGYGTGEYDGQGSGHFGDTVWHPSHGYANNCDGGRGHWACDYKQQ
mmetsp:Transcript_32436/g.79091  ORF Transcript_32436/g.79091 Transcript_32436/m.79091 type:complete len:99 (-) Transcript_32436:349-645(-)